MLRLTLARYLREVPGNASVGGRALILAVACLGGAPAFSQTAPIDFDESVDGQVLRHPTPSPGADARPAEVAAFGVGTNVVRGTARWDAVFADTTFDTFVARLPADLEIVSITFTVSNVSGPGRLDQIYGAIWEYDAPMTSSSELAGTGFLTAPFPATAVFDSLLPLATPEIYGFCLCGFQGPLDAGEFVTFDYTWRIVVGAVPESGSPRRRY